MDINLTVVFGEVFILQQKGMLETINIIYKIDL